MTDDAAYCDNYIKNASPEERAVIDLENDLVRTWTPCNLLLCTLFIDGHAFTVQRIILATSLNSKI